jgi:uncharacterized glyoxalase superfamily protein PhnB
MSWSIAPYFLVNDVVAAANFYRDKLGFRYDRFWGEPPCFCMVRRAGVTIMLSELARGSDESRTPRPPNPNGRVAPAEDCWDAYLWVEDADVLHEEFAAQGAKIVRSVCDQEYGCRDFEVLDVDGYRLCFGHNTQS